MWTRDENPKWIKISSNIIFTPLPEKMATDFYGLFIESYFEKEPIYLDLRNFTKQQAYKFTSIIRKLSGDSTNVVFVFKKK